MKPFNKKEEKINKHKKKLYIIIGVLVLVTIIISYKTFAAFIEETPEANVISGTVEDYRQAKYIKYDNTNVNLECETIQCALEKIDELLEE